MVSRTWPLSQGHFPMPFCHVRWSWRESHAPYLHCHGNLGLSCFGCCFILPGQRQISFRAQPRPPVGKRERAALGACVRTTPCFPQGLLQLLLLHSFLKDTACYCSGSYSVRPQPLNLQCSGSRMPTASTGEWKPWVLEVTGLSVPVAVLGLVGFCCDLVFHTISTYLLSPFFPPAFIPSRLSERYSSMASQNMQSQRRSRSILSESHCA